MKISIIIPTFNCGSYIQKAIESVLQQPYQNKELIVIDGNSKDNTIDILKSYGNSIKWISEKDAGQADAINKGFRLASGDIATWLNADDYYEDNIFEEVVRVFQDPDVVLVYGQCISETPNTQMLNTPPKNVTRKLLLTKGNVIYQPSSFYRYSSLKQINYTDASLHYWMEYDLFIKLLGLGKSVYLTTPLSRFTIRADQKSNIKNRIGMNKELMMINQRYNRSKFNWFSIKTYLKNTILSIKYD